MKERKRHLTPGYCWDTGSEDSRLFGDCSGTHLERVPGPGRGVMKYTWVEQVLS